MHYFLLVYSTIGTYYCTNMWFYYLVLFKFAASQSAEIFCRQKHPSADFKLDIHFHHWTRNLSTIRNLTITESQLTHFQANNPRLSFKCVDLSHNKLYGWPTFDCSSSIEYLNLSGNFINMWTPTKFHNLRVLDISNNFITTIELEPILRRLPELKVLFLHGNPVHIFSDLRRVPSLNTVVLSASHWYAVNSVDFGRYPVQVLMNTSKMVRDLRFECTDRPDNRLIDLSQCAEIFMADFGEVKPRDVCFSCYICTQLTKIISMKTVNDKIRTKTDCNCGPIIATSVAIFCAFLFVCGSALYGVKLCRKRIRLEFQQRKLMLVSAKFGTDSNPGSRYGVVDLTNSPIYVLSSKKKFISDPPPEHVRLRLSEDTY